MQWITAVISLKTITPEGIKQVNMAEYDRWYFDPFPPWRDVVHMWGFAGVSETNKKESSSS